MKKFYTLLPLAICAIQQTTAQYNTPYISKPASTSIYESNWQLNVGVGYGTYYGDMSRYNIRGFKDAGNVARFLNYNKNYIKEPSFHLSVVKRLGLTSTGLGLNFNRTLIQGSDRYVTNSGILQTNDPNFSRSLNFKTDILDAGLSLNLNAFNKGFFSPYLTLGTGFSFFDVRGDLFTGPNQNQAYLYNTPQSINDGTFETKLRDELTETDEKYPNTVFYAQALLGFNFRFSNNFSLAVESDIKYSGSDYLDDLSGRYKTSYPNMRSQYVAKPGNNVSNPQTGSRGRNDDVNDFYIQNRIVFRFHIPKYPKRAEVKKINTSFNAPVLYPNNYNIPVDSSTYARSVWSMNNRSAIRADSIKQRRMQDSLMIRRMDSVRIDSLRRTAVNNIKMDSSFTNEVKALRQEIASLRQTIDKNSQQNRIDSIAVRRATLKDSLNRDLQRLQQKKNKTATENLQQQIYQLRLDSIALAEKYAAKSDTVLVDDQRVNSVTPVTTTSNASTGLSREDSLQRVIDSIRNINTATRNVVRQPVVQPQPTRNVRTIRDTLSPTQVQQYQQQVAGIAYRSRQNSVTNAQLQSKTDSINRINASIRASDSLKTVYYQNRLTQAQQEEEEIKKTERRGLLVKKSDELKQAEKERAKAKSNFQQTQIARQQAEQNSRVAAGDTFYITNLQAQVNRRQAEIDSLKKTKKVVDIFSDKNKRIKELEQQQKDQQRQVDDANRMLQYYRTTGPTSYYQPNDNDQRRINRLNDRVDDLQNQRYSNYQYPPVNVASPVVVSDNNDERRRMQREIDSLRTQVTRLQQVRRDTMVQSSVMLDSVVSRPVIASTTPASQMAALQRQLTELNSRLDAVNKPSVAKPQPVVTDTAVNSDVTTVYFNRGSILLTTLQKAKLTALVKKSPKSSSYSLVASSDNTTGNTAANEALARKRAAAVATYLRSRGVATAKITTSVSAITAVPGGQPDPLARRVDVTVQ